MSAASRIADIVDELEANLAATERALQAAQHQKAALHRELREAARNIDDLEHALAIAHRYGKPQPQPKPKPVVRAENLGAEQIPASAIWGAPDSEPTRWRADNPFHGMSFVEFDRRNLDRGSFSAAAPVATEPVDSEAAEPIEPAGPEGPAVRAVELPAEKEDRCCPPETVTLSRMPTPFECGKAYRNSHGSVWGDGWGVLRLLEQLLVPCPATAHTVAAPGRSGLDGPEGPARDGVAGEDH